MPYLKVQTNAEVQDKDSIIKDASRLVSEELGKPEDYVMVALESGTKMCLAGNTDKTAYMELKSLGLPESQTPALSKALGNFAEEKLGIDPGRVYIVFSDVERSMWGWNKSTF